MNKETQCSLSLLSAIWTCGLIKNLNSKMTFFFPWRTLYLNVCNEANIKSSTSSSQTIGVASEYEVIKFMQMWAKTRWLALQQIVTFKFMMKNKCQVSKREGSSRLCRDLLCCLIGHINSALYQYLWKQGSWSSNPASYLFRKQPLDSFSGVGDNRAPFRQYITFWRCCTSYNETKHKTT